jgi:hypothetical protein
MKTDFSSSEKVIEKHMEVMTAISIITFDKKTQSIHY